MDIGGHHVADCFVNEPVPPYDRQAGESFRNELDREVAVSAGRAGMTGRDYTIATPEEAKYVAAIESLIGNPIHHTVTAARLPR